MSYHAETTPSSQLQPANSHCETMTSLRVPFLLLVRTSTFYFVVGSFLALLSALKLVIPSFLDGISFLTYGRLFPVACDLFVYGWAIPGGLAMSLWFTVRFSNIKLRYTKVLVSAAVLWSLGVFLSSLAVLSGYSTSVELLEYPAWGSFILFVAFLLMGVWVILTMKAHQHFSLSQCYFLTALCSFPWAYGTANIFLVWSSLQGSAQGPIHFWYISALFGLCFIPLALGAVYYLLPKIIGTSKDSYLDVAGFFSFLLFVAWSGMTLLIGGPVPAWMVSASVVATILLILPMSALLVNFFKMLCGKKSLLIKSPTLRFLYVGILFFIISGFLALVNAVPTFNAIFHFTDYTIGLFVSILIGFFGMILFGSFYYILPRITGVIWCSTGCILRHFWMIAIGVTLLVVASFLGGLMEGVALNDPAIAFINILSYGFPWRCLMVVGWALIFLGSISFARLLVMMQWQTLIRKSQFQLLNCKFQEN